MRISRDRVLATSTPELWAIIGDPSALARWWPRVDRVESVDHAGFTELYRTRSGTQVRADFRIATLVADREIRVVQALEGTPFANIFAASSKRALLEAVADGTRVTLELDQTPAGMARFGGLMLRGAMRKQLDAAHDALARLVERGG